MASACPYEQLFVYVLDGVVERREEHLLGELFLGNWVEEGISVLFFSAPARRELEVLASARPDLRISGEHTFTYEQWQGVYSSIRIAEFVFHTPWHDGPHETSSSSIIFDPGLVFGNGLHPTTKHCVEALCRLWPEWRPRSVMDLGAGSGILSLVAARLGAEKVTAVDLNRLCVKTASRNVSLNGLEGIVEVLEGSAKSFANMDADLVVANIDFPVIKEFMGSRAFKEGDLFVLSGLMRSQVSELLALLRLLGLTLLGRWDADLTWFTVAAVAGGGAVRG